MFRDWDGSLKVIGQFKSKYTISWCQLANRSKTCVCGKNAGLTVDRLGPMGPGGAVLQIDELLDRLHE